MKTILNELLEWINKNETRDSRELPFKSKIRDKIQGLILKEKDMIEIAFEMGESTMDILIRTDEELFKDSEDYYNKTYSNEK